jgi:hypothetical protein
MPCALGLKAHPRAPGQPDPRGVTEHPAPWPPQHPAGRMGRQAVWLPRRARPAARALGVFPSRAVGDARGPRLQASRQGGLYWGQLGIGGKLRVCRDSWSLESQVWEGLRVGANVPAVGVEPSHQAGRRARGACCMRRLGACRGRRRPGRGLRGPGCALGAHSQERAGCRGVLPTHAPGPSVFVSAKWGGAGRGPLVGLRRWKRWLGEASKGTGRGGGRRSKYAGCMHADCCWLRGLGAERWHAAPHNRCRGGRRCCSDPQPPGRGRGAAQGCQAMKGRGRGARGPLPRRRTVTDDQGGGPRD